MTQEEKDKRIAELEKELAELKQAPVSERWRPMKRGKYYLVNDIGNVDSTLDTNEDFDKCHWFIGNMFKTREEAEEHKKEIETYFKFKNFVEDRSEPLDYNNEDQDKYFCYYRSDDNSIRFGREFRCKTQGVIYASSDEILISAIDYIGGEEVAKRYLFGIKE